MEAFGFPVVSDQGKKYLLGALPIADAFILWANIAGESKEPAFGWAITFHLYSMLILVLSLAVLYFSGLERDIL